MRLQRSLNVSIGLLFLGAAVALWAMPRDTDPPSQAITAARVTLDRVQTVDSRRGARFSGVTQARDRAVLSFSVPARLAGRLVEPGSRVAAGDTLAFLDDREFRNAVDQAEAALGELQAQLEQAGRDRRRVEQLAAAQVVTVSDLEKTVTRQAALQAAHQAARARLNEARRLLKESVLKAPFSGTVTGIHLHAGEWAVPGRPAVELTGDGDLELLVEVPESVVVHLTAGDSVRVLLPFAEDRIVPGRIATVANAALSAGRLFPIKVDLDAATGLTAGLTAQLLLDLPTQRSLSVPLAAVVNPGASRPHVFIYHQGRVTRQAVQLGAIVGERIVVRGALAEGEPVVVSGQSRLADGDRVEVVEVGP